MPTVYFITHPDVVVDPALPIERWPLSALGRRRMQHVNDHEWAGRCRRVFASGEQKALDGAEIFCASRGLTPEVIVELGENDRSATGFLEPAEFWQVVEEFFDRPEASVRGWERAIDAQSRIVTAVSEAVRRAGDGGPVAVIAHGGVGCLLLCHVKGVPISRLEEQPRPDEGAPPGSGGGCYFAFDGATGALIQDWTRLDP